MRQVSYSIQLAVKAGQRPHWSETPHAVCLRISLHSSHIRSFLHSIDFERSDTSRSTACVRIDASENVAQDVSDHAV
jgi:hypothetical protein